MSVEIKQFLHPGRPVLGHVKRGSVLVLAVGELTAAETHM